MTKIKICGITNLKDALSACEAGADALGFVFAPSPRRVPLGRAASICRELPPFICRVGVFVNQSAAFINRAVEKCRLDYVQLHGDETPAFCRKIRSKVIKAFRVNEGFRAREIKRYSVSAVLFDAYRQGTYGGTGKTFDWDIALRAKRAGVPLILSGGLGPGNLASAVKKVRPSAVDLSSGVERSPGVKSAVKMKKAVAIVRRACII